MSRIHLVWITSLVFACGCGDNAPGGDPDAASADAASADAAPGAADASVDAKTDPGHAGTLRLMAANISSGDDQGYHDPGIHILQGLKPDIVMMQEMNIGGANDQAAAEAFVKATFGDGWSTCRDATGVHIPNGIVSRYPILTCDNWDDPEIGDRNFTYARIDVPGDVDLWAISVHLKAGSGSTDKTRRIAEAEALVARIAALPPRDYVVLGGDFNTSSRDEGCVGALGQQLVIGGKATDDSIGYPADQTGNQNTNAGRKDPYDWVLTDADLDGAAHRADVVIGDKRYPHGLVFDSRKYTPLSDVAPVVLGDSGATNMQHMAVIRDVVLP